MNIRPAHSFTRSFIRSSNQSQSIEQVGGQTFFYIRMNTLHFHMDALERDKRMFLHVCLCDLVENGAENEESIDISYKVFYTIYQRIIA